MSSWTGLIRTSRRASPCAARGLFPVLVIDEANVALPSPRPPKAPGDTRPEPPLTPDEARVRKRTLAALGLLTLLSKESKRLNVLLAASEHAEPFRLAELGYSTAHMTKVVVASEVPPAEMRAMLVDKWRCGPALTHGGPWPTRPGSDKPGRRADQLPYITEGR
jgi:hypothetical protein